MLKKQATYFACIIILCTSFLQTISAKISPAAPPHQATTPPIVTMPVTPPALTVQNNTKVLSQPNNRQVSINSTVSGPKIIAPPVPTNPNIQQKIQLAITQPTPQPVSPSFLNFAHPADSSPLAFAAILTAGIAYHFGSSSPAPGRTQPKQRNLDKKNTHHYATKKTGLDYIIDQQYSRLTHIARKYEKALQNNPLYQSKQYKTRIQKRINAIKEWQSSPQKYNYNNFQKSLHSYIQKSNSAYTTATTDPIQRALHKEIISIGKELANFQALAPNISGYLCNCAMLFMDISQTYNGSNIIVQAMNAADICWEIITAAHTAGPDIFFSKTTEQMWQQYFVYSQAQLPECTVDWNQFEWEKTRWGSLQKQCKELLNGCTVLIQNTQTEIEKNVSIIGSSLSRVAKTIDNFLVNEVAVKIDSFCRLVGQTTSKMAQQCKQKLVDLVSKAQEKVTDFVAYLYNQIPSPQKIMAGIAMNAVTVYLAADLFSNNENLITLQDAVILGTIMNFAGLSKVIFSAATENPMQAFIIGAALLTPIVSPLIEQYRSNQKIIHPECA